MKALLARLRCLFGWHSKPVIRREGVRRPHRQLVIYRVTYCSVCGEVLHREEIARTRKR